MAGQSRPTSLPSDPIPSTMHQGPPLPAMRVSPPSPRKPRRTTRLCWLPHASVTLPAALSHNGYNDYNGFGGYRKSARLQTVLSSQISLSLYIKKYVTRCLATCANFDTPQNHCNHCNHYGRRGIGERSERLAGIARILQNATTERGDRHPVDNAAGAISGEWEAPNEPAEPVQARWRSGRSRHDVPGPAETGRQASGHIGRPDTREPVQRRAHTLR